MTIIPIQLNFDFLAKFRLGPNFNSGRVQEIKAEFGDLQLKIGDC